MGTGLTVGVFMTAASLAGVWLWYTGALQKLAGYSSGMLTSVLVVVTLMCKNMGALALLLFGVVTLFSIPILRRSLLVYLLILSPIAYVGVRTTGVWSAESMVEMASMIHKQRGASLADRLRNDSMLAEKALKRPAFGWGGWGRSRIYREDGKDITITDGLWIMTLGDMGLVGLAALLAVLLAPAAAFERRFPARYWTDPRIAPAAVAATLVILYMIDNLFNSMFNPLYVMAAAGLVSLVAAQRPVRARRAVTAAGPKLEPTWGVS
jgi:O-antigen ligase